MPAPSEPPLTSSQSGSSGFHALPDPANLRPEEDQRDVVVRAKIIDSMLTTLAQCQFPATPSEISACVGDKPLTLGETEVAVRDVLGILPPRTYDNAAALKEDLMDHWDRVDALRDG